MMKKILNYLMFFASITFSACDDDKTIYDPVIPDPEIIITDLSENGTANCYVVTKPGIYSFSANVIGNGDTGIIDFVAFHTNESYILPASVKVVWQDYYDSGAGLIDSIALNTAKNKVIFKTSETFIPGNALIAACDNNGNILWSWHIWLPAVEITSINSATGYEVMNVNLGALTDEAGNPESYGMLYQWGRKDPFPASATLTGTTTTMSAPLYDMQGNTVTIQNSSWTDLNDNNIAYSIRNPAVCISNNAQYSTSRDWIKANRSTDALWGNPDGNQKDSDGNYINKGKKSCYDPCPVGWRVPPADVFRNFITPNPLNMAFAVSDFNIIDIDNNGILDINDYNYGWVFKLDENASSYFPAAARFDGQYAMLMGSVSGVWGSYWSNTPYGSTNGTSVVPLSFQTNNYNGTPGIATMILFNGSRADAYSVRCVKE
ncbi:MAG: fibrobacter succinogenes major paralogous domain-containing protein [Prevotellaceae bacterium]|nr:fibrobacter succinogenes major paralogous domain-containing protein [Prevotellaceae bacterium]